MADWPTFLVLMVPHLLFLLSLVVSAHAHDDETYIRRCIELAKEAQRAGGGPYGAVIVSPGVGIIAEGHNHAANNPIWHGEMAAIANLSALIMPRSVYAMAPELDLYTSAEPCPMCMSAIEWSGFRRVVYGTSIPYIQEYGGSQIDIRATEVAARSPKKTAVVGGVLANETNPLYSSTGSASQHIGDEEHDNHDRKLLYSILRSGTMDIVHS
mmetsp:Transcript_40950/g.61871  ORF Transcript_40950/g.61871 Transcript_40950/m.61871 type:complete len:212 (+) Transcript_40950:45-680(+)